MAVCAGSDEPVASVSSDEKDVGEAVCMVE